MQRKSFLSNMQRKSLLSVAGAAALAVTLALTGCTSKAEVTEAAGQSDQSGQSQSGDESAQSGAEQLEDVDGASGPEVDRDPQGELPEITLPKDDTAPEMKPIDADPPKVITVKTLVEGAGAKVGPDDFIKVNYAGFLWDGKQFDSSFTSAGQPTPISFSLNQVIQGWKWGLADTRVGDTVMIVIPPEYGYGNQDSERIPAGSTLVFYVEILEAVSVQKEVLKDAEPTGAALPEGITIEGDLGTAPEIVFEKNAPVPSKADTIVVAEGKGSVISDDESVEYLMTVGYWGSQERSHTWEDGVGLVDPGSALAGERVGSRVLIISPSEDEAVPATFVLVDILAAHPPR